MFPTAPTFRSLPPRLALSALMLALALPFLGAEHYLPIASFRQEWLAGLLGLLALAACTLQAPPREGWPLPLCALLPLGWVLLLGLQFAAGKVLFESGLMAALYLVWAFALMVCVRGIGEALGRERVADALAAALVVGAVLAATTGALQRLAPEIGLPWIFPSKQIIGNLAQPNNFADYLWIGIAAALWLHARRRLPLPLLLAVLPWLLALSLLSGSRSVYFYAVALAAWLAWWSHHAEGSQRRRLRVLAATLLPLLLTTQLVLALADVPVSSMQRVTSQGGYDPVRLTLWRAALEIFLQQPLLGAGFDSYSREFFGRIGDYPVNGIGIPEHSHNLVTEVAAEFGIAGLAFLIVSIAVWIAGVRRRGAEATVQLAIGVLLVLAIHSMLEYPLWYAHFLAIAALMVALADGRCARVAMAPRHRILLGFVAAAGIAVLAGLRSDYLRLEAAAQGATPDGLALPVATQHAELLDIYRHSLLAPYAVLQFAARMPIEGSDAPARLALLAEATHFSPIRQAVFRQAMLQALGGDASVAAQQWRRAALAYPGEEKEAVALLRDAAAHEPALARLLAGLNSADGHPSALPQTGP